MQDSEGSREGEAGFTLIELMVVIVVIAILMLIGIPAFLGAKDRANDRAVESNVRNAFTAARTYYSDKLQYTADPAVMTSEEPTLHWTNTPLDGTQPPDTIYIETQNYPSANQTVVVVGRSKAGRCFYLRDVMSGGTTGTYYGASVPSGANCSVPLINDPGWSNSWPK